MVASDSWLICTACGTQFPTADRAALATCFICDDPRQFTPPSGQQFTTLAEMRSSSYKNEFVPITLTKAVDGIAPAAETSMQFVSIRTEPKFAIGQRAVLIRGCTPSGGNVLWDCVTFLDEATVRMIRDLGGVEAIVISHPHYYTTHREWARVLGCDVYLAAEDAEWLAQRDGECGDGGDDDHDGGVESSPGRRSGRQRFLEAGKTDFDVHGVKVLKLGGHFPGSLVALYEGRLFVADTLVTTPAGLGSWVKDGAGRPREDSIPLDERRVRSWRPPGMNSYSFMWSIPNMIPLPPDELARMWGVLRRHEFKISHGAFVGTDVVGRSVREMRERVLQSMQIQIRGSGHADHPLLREVVEE